MVLCVNSPIAIYPCMVHKPVVWHSHMSQGQTQGPGSESVTNWSHCDTELRVTEICDTETRLTHLLTQVSILRKSVLSIEFSVVKFQSQLRSKFSELNVPQIFGEHISNVFVSFNEEDFNLAFHYFLSNKVVAYVDMLSAAVLYWV